MTGAPTDLISIIVPIYNVEEYLPRCVDSIIAQTYENLEIILVDDGSPDNCPYLCDQYKKQDNRIKVLHKSNGGLSEARNAGLEIATGDYIGFVDSDDWIEPDMYEYLINGIIENNAEISYCEAYRVKQHTIEFNITEDKVLGRKEALRTLYSDELENYAWNKLYKANLWKDVRFPVGLNFEDIATIYKTFELCNKVAVLSEPKYYYRIRENSISGKRDFLFNLHLFRAIINRYEDASQRTPELKKELSRRVVLFYIKRVCSSVKNNPADDLKNDELLALLSTFVRNHFDEIIDEWKLKGLEKKALSAFAEGTNNGCLKYLKINRFRLILKKFIHFI